MMPASARSRAILLTLLANAAAWTAAPWLLRDRGDTADALLDSAAEVERFSAHLRIWHELQAREDAAAVLNRAAAFAQLEPEKRNALRKLQEIVEAVMRETTPARRSYLLKLPPAARAVEVGRELQERHPDKLAQALMLFRPMR